MKNLLSNALSSYLTDFKVTFSGASNITGTIPKLTNIPFILKNEPFSLYFFIKDFDRDMLATIEYKDDNNNTYHHNLSVHSLLNGTILTKFAYKQLIDDILLSHDIDKQPIIQISLKHQILTKFTGFILKIQDNENNILELVPIRIPNIRSVDHIDNMYAEYMREDSLLLMDTEGEAVILGDDPIDIILLAMPNAPKRMI
jgi:hypothetical protein